MLKKLVFTILLSLFCVHTFSAQTSNQQWEYLIVSVINLGDKKDLSVSEKWMGVRQGKLGFSQEVLTQNEFDRLGKLGWELVSSIPLFDANQNLSFSSSKFIFKRLFNAERSQREAEELTKLINELKNNQLQSKPQVADLIELDRADILAEQNKTADKIKTKLELAIKNASPATIVNLRVDYQSSNKTVYSELVVDGSSALLKEGNKYRASEAKEFARRIATVIFNKIGLEKVPSNNNFYYDDGSFENRGNVLIKLSVIINYNGQNREIAQSYINGNAIQPLEEK